MWQMIKFSIIKHRWMKSNGLINEIRLAIKELQKGWWETTCHLTPARINRHGILAHPPYVQILATPLPGRRHRPPRWRRRGTWTWPGGTHGGGGGGATRRQAMRRPCSYAVPGLGRCGNKLAEQGRTITGGATRHSSTGVYGDRSRAAACGLTRRCDLTRQCGGGAVWSWRSRCRRWVSTAEDPLS
jgi:hypothetical protein